MWTKSHVAELYDRGQYCVCVCGGKYEATEGNLKETILYFGGENDLDTLVNIVVCSQYLGKYGGRAGQVSKCIEGGACIASVCSGTCAS